MGSIPVCGTNKHYLVHIRIIMPGCLLGQMGLSPIRGAKNNFVYVIIRIIVLMCVITHIKNNSAEPEQGAWA